MSRQDRLLAKLARANPEPDENFEVDADWASYLEMLETRDDDSAGSTRRALRLRGSTTRRATVLAAAAAIVLVLIGLLIGSERQDVASARDLALAESFLDSFVDGDAQSAVSLLAPGAVLGGEISGDLGEFSALLDWFEVTGHEWSISSCTTSSASSHDIACQMDWGNAWSTALESGPYPGEFRFIVESGRITGFFISTGIAREYGLVSEELDAFRVEHYGDRREVMYEDGVNEPRLTPESIALWAQLTSEFVDEKSQ